LRLRDLGDTLGSAIFLFAVTAFLWFSIGTLVTATIGAKNVSFVNPFRPLSRRRKLMGEGVCPAAVTQRMHFHPDSVLPFVQLQRARTPWNVKVPVVAAAAPCQLTHASND
jgi:hypothetical protein